jgi:Dolichyl-phosphate-mannose-protein mannosyltransferase
MPYDPISVVVIVAAGGLLFAASRTAPLAVRVAVVVLAALIIRADAAAYRSLSEWDERYHAVVAKNLISEPLKPTLYRRPLVAYDYRDWHHNHVWLHKPPGALWLMAGSMSLFGVNELGLRLPSLLMSTGSVLLTFLIGSMVWNARVGLVAAGFHAVNGFLVALAAGRRVADHVDTALIFFVELGILMVLLHARRGSMMTLAAAGAALGAALLTKSMPALLIVAVAFFAFGRRGRWSTTSLRVCVILLIGGAIAAPWTLYTRNAFPQETAWATDYMLRHLTETLEQQTADALTYFRDLPRFFGELVWLSLLGSAYLLHRDTNRPEERAILAWAAVPYVVFSLVQTRMPGYVMVAAPALFLMQAHFWCWLFDRRASMTARWQRIATTTLLIALMALPARYLLAPTNVFERRDRDPASTRELRTLQERLRLRDAVIFNMPSPIEAMFYSPYTVYAQLPTSEQVDALNANGIAIVLYEPAGTRLQVPDHWRVILLRASP